MAKTLTEEEVAEMLNSASDDALDFAEIEIERAFSGRSRKRYFRENREDIIEQLYDSAAAYLTDQGYDEKQFEEALRSLIPEYISDYLE
jgi:hypothetical protein